MSVLSKTSRTIFTKHNVATTGYIYNSSNGANATTGWTDANYDDVVVQMCVATLNSTASLNYRIEGMYTNGRKAEIFTEVVTSAHTIDKLIYVSEKLSQIRVGAKVGVIVASPLASPAFIYSSIIRTEYK